jgi:beta-glucanase (GH16 family)
MDGGWDRMEAHRGSSGEHHAGARLIDGAILVLSVTLAASIAAVIGARTQEQEGYHGAAPQQGVAEAVQSSANYRGWRLVWHDEFNQKRCPSRRNWHFEHGFVRNGELQWYQPQNASCRDGVLVIEARRQVTQNPNYHAGSPNWKLNRRTADYTSTSMASRFSFTSGRAEALIRIDPRSGSWPAFWTLGDGFWGRNRIWPAAGEVDIMEYYGHTVLANVCNPKPSWCGWSSTTQSLASLGGPAWADRFHLWAMDWSPKRIVISLDGRPVNRVNMANVAHPGRPNPYVNVDAFLLLSQAIGGAHGGDPGRTKFPVRLEARWVRIYQRANRPPARDQ